MRRLARPNRFFFAQPLPLVRIPRSRPLLRLHDAQFPALHFSRSGDSRFDSPDNSFGSLYLAQHIQGAFVEVFCRQQQRRVTEAQLARSHVAEFQFSRNLKLVDLAGKGLVRMGLDARITTGNYRLAQQWAQAIHAHPGQADGILYLSRHDPTQKLVALFDRASPCITVHSIGPLATCMEQDIWELLNRYDIALLPGTAYRPG